MPGSPDEFNEALYSIAGKSRLWPDDLEFLAQCLDNKWYGVQVVAAKVLAKFHPSEALPLLKDWLMRHINNYSLTKIAQKALLSCISADDLPWIFDLYQKDNFTHRLFLIAALSQFPDKSIFQALIEDCQNQQNWHSMVVLAATLYTDRDTVLQKLLKNPDFTYKTKLDLQEMFRHGPLSRDQFVIFQRFGNPV
jgi:hypothetical protein